MPRKQPILAAAVSLGLLLLLLPSSNVVASSRRPPARKPAKSATPPPGENPAQPYTFDSRYYTVTTNLDQERVKEIALYMDAVYAEYAGRLSNFRRNVRSGIKEDQRMPLYVMRTYDDYLALLADFGVNGANTAGVYFRTPKASGLATWVEGQSRAARNHVLQHEGFHQFADAKISSLLPPWVNEGLAEYFGDGIMVRGRLQIGRVDGRHLARVQQAIRDGATLDFREFLTMDGRRWNDRVASGDKSSGVMYDMAWSVVHFLVHGGRGRYQPALEQYLDIMNRGSEAKVAFDQVFGKDVDAFAMAWARETLQTQPDPWATSVGHLERVAQLLQLLHGAGAQVSSLDELKGEVERRGVRMAAAPAAHGNNEPKAKAKKGGNDDQADEADEADEAGEAGEAGEPTFDLGFPAPAAPEVVASKDPKLPPGMVVRKVSPEIVLTWKLDKEGKPEAQIDFGKK